MRWFVIGLILLPAQAFALPNMIRLGYVNCVTCHVSPQGAGMLNEYGRGIDDAQSLRAGEYQPTSSRFLSALSIKGRIDQDVRAVPSMALSHTPGGPYTTVDLTRFFYRNVTTLGKGFRASAVVNGENESSPRKAKPYDPTIKPGHVVVTSALLQYRPIEGVEFAAGRDALPTGINISDQSTFIKARNRLGYYDTPNQAKAFFWGKRWLATPFVFTPSGNEPAGARERGEGMIAEYDLLGRGATVAGVTVTRGTDRTGHRLVTGAYTRLGFGPWGILAEHDMTTRHLNDPRVPQGFRQQTSYAQLFVYPREWFLLAAITERLTVQRPYAESLWAFKGEASMRLSSNWTLSLRSGAQRDALSGKWTPIASVQFAAKTVN